MDCKHPVHHDCVTIGLPISTFLLSAQRALESTPRTCVHGVGRGKRSRDHHGAMENMGTWTEIARGHLGNGEEGMNSLCANIQSHKTSPFKCPTAVEHHHAALMLFEGVPPSQPSSAAHLSIHFLQLNQSEGGLRGAGRPLRTLPGLAAMPIPTGASSSQAGRLCPIPADFQLSSMTQVPLKIPAHSFSAERSLEISERHTFVLYPWFLKARGVNPQGCSQSSFWYHYVRFHLFFQETDTVLVLFPQHI